jgi:hypothetical protein
MTKPITLTQDKATFLKLSMVHASEDDPIVGDYLLSIDWSVRLRKNPEKIFSDGLFTNNSLFSLLKVTKITRNSIYTVAAEGYGDYKYFRYAKEGEVWRQKYPKYETEHKYCSGRLSSVSAHEVFSEPLADFIEAYCLEETACNHCQKLVDSFHQGKYYNTGICDDCYKSGVRDDCSCHNCEELD